MNFISYKFWLNEDYENDFNWLIKYLDHWVSYAGAYDELNKIANLSKKLNIKSKPLSKVYRCVSGYNDEKFTPKEILDFDKIQKYVSTSKTYKSAMLFSGGDWTYMIEYKPFIVIDFEDFSKRYNWNNDSEEREVIIDVTKSEVLSIKKIYE